MAILPTSYLCIKCKKIKPWYKFQYGVHDKEGLEVCFNCNKHGYNTNDVLEKIQIEYRIERLIKSAMKNKMQDLRNHLFETLEKVKDDEMTIEKAKAVCEIAQVLINTAKVEVEYIKAIGSKAGSQFMQLENGLQKDLITNSHDQL